ncbi:MAG TPA: hypothetical protein VHS28_05135, partial [Chloroflexota bacterium]|nr:hypothetical protein [Chloroflexota bacterium]
PVVTGFLEVKHGITGEDAVLMEGWSLNDDGEQGQECIEILEPTMCAALRHYVVDFFEHRTSPPSSDKREVIQFLETQIRRIREQSPEM